MGFQTGSALLDAIVLAAVSRDEEGAYGYQLTQQVRRVLDISESTLYPVLRRLGRDGYLRTYDREYCGRNRRYYQITKQGRETLEAYIREWGGYSGRISRFFEEGQHES